MIGGIKDLDNTLMTSQHLFIFTTTTSPNKIVQLMCQAFIWEIQKDNKEV